MPLPTSGPISLAAIQAEFGGTNPISLSEYYAGGGLVPTGTTGTNGAVPSSGQISLWNFYGTSNSTIPIINISPTVQSQSATSAFYTFLPVTVTVTNATVTGYNWIFSNADPGPTWTVPSGQGTATATPRVSGVVNTGITYYADFFCRITLLGGSTTDSPVCSLDYIRLDI